MIQEDQQIFYPRDKHGFIIGEVRKCVMCDNVATTIAKETNEPLCEPHFKINLQLRKERELRHQ